METGVIYRIVCYANGKSYIGQTIDKLTKRIAAHFKPSGHLQHGPKFDNAIKKYGKSRFYYGILCECATEDLDKEEINFIELFDTIENGYNTDSGGNKLKRLSSETKKKMSEAALRNWNGNESRKRLVSAVHRGKTLSSEAKEKLRKANVGKKMSEKNRAALIEARKNYVCSDETRKKLSAAKLGHKVSFEVRKILSDKAKARPNKSCKTYVFENLVIGELHIVSNGFRKFCKNHGLSLFYMEKVRSGKLESHDGWTVKKQDKC